MKSIFKLTTSISLICLISLLSACKKQNLSELNADLVNPYQLNNKLLNFSESDNYINFRSSDYYHFGGTKKCFYQTDYFYFENEIMEITDIVYNQNANQINIKLNLNAYFKKLSCGFIITHQIKDAKLKGIIKL